MVMEPMEAGMGLGGATEWRGRVVSDVEAVLACRLQLSEPALFSVEPAEFYLPPLGSVEVALRRGPAETERLDRLHVQHMLFRGPLGPDSPRPTAAMAAGQAQTPPLPVLEAQLPLLSHKAHPAPPALFALASAHAPAQTFFPNAVVDHI